MHKNHELFTDKVNTILILILVFNFSLAGGLNNMACTTGSWYCYYNPSCTLKRNTISYVVLHQKCMAG